MSYHIRRGQCTRTPIASRKAPDLLSCVIAFVDILSSLKSATGGNVGLMGEIARTVAAGLGPESVIGVIPSHLQSREVSPISS